MKIIVNDKASFYFGREAEIVETNTINGLTIHRVLIRTYAGGEITFAVLDSEVLPLHEWHEVKFSDGKILSLSGNLEVTKEKALKRCAAMNCEILEISPK